MRKIIGGEYKFIATNLALVADLTDYPYRDGLLFEMMDKPEYGGFVYESKVGQALIIDDIENVIKGNKEFIVITSQIKGKSYIEVINKDHPLLNKEYDSERFFQKLHGSFGYYAKNELPYAIMCGSYVDSDGQTRTFEDASMIIPTPTLYEHFLKVLEDYGLSVNGLDNCLCTTRTDSPLISSTENLI